jgi:hypothetical protein
MNGQLRGLALFALFASIGPQAFAVDGQNAKTGPAAKKPAGGAKPAGNRPAGPPNVRPNDKPQLNRPTGAAKPPANTMEKVKPQPGGNRPGNLPANGGKPIAKPDFKSPDKGNKLPNKDNMIGNRPVTRPGTRPDEMGDKRPGRPDNRPPSLGGNVGDKPTTLPAPIGKPGSGGRPVGKPDSKFPDKGNMVGDRPVTRPGGEMGDKRPGRPDNRPPGFGGNVGDKPTTLPAPIGKPGQGGRPGEGGRPGNRPSPDELKGFLGMHRPIEPGTGPGGNRPKPGAPGSVHPPATTLPAKNRPIQIGDKRNTNINKRPTWVNINKQQINVINNSWNKAITVRPSNPAMGLHDWGRYHPTRVAYWNGWANGVRSGWRWPAGRNAWFTPTWWQRYPYAVGGWSYTYRVASRPWNYWWTYPTWAVLPRWFVWPAPPVAVWSQPIYYDYGPGGNVVYRNNEVYIAGQPVATADEFAQSAAALASVPPPANEVEAEQADWLPLGTFALSTGQKDVEPSQIVQLAVDKQGIVSGTLFNQQTDTAQAVQGQVDKDTQRVAFRVGDNDNIVAETGLYNLTQEEAPLLVHVGAEQTENYLLVRLESPETAKAP